MNTFVDYPQEGKELWMRAALAEGWRALDTCRPNPPVGCVIVRGDRIVARGHTGAPGRDHAEAMALRALHGAADDMAMFVTLEPCSFFGRTPSCAQALAGSGLARIYVGIVDPHPRNRGAGIRILRQAGLEFEVGILATEIERALGPFLIRTDDRT